MASIGQLKQVLVFTALALTLVGLGPKALASEVKLYTWQVYLSDEVVEAFERDTGHTLEQFHYDSEDNRDAVITSGRAGSFDLVMVDAYSLRALSQGGYFHDMSQLPLKNRKHIGQEWQDECGRFGIPYATGNLGIAYRSSVNKTPIHSWNQLFEPADEHKGRVAMLFDSIDSVSAALLASGFSAQSEDKAELKVAYDKLVAQKPYVATYDYITSYVLNLDEPSTISLAMVYSSDIWVLHEITGQDDWVYVTPDEGSTEWVDCLSIVASHPVHDGTLEFLDYLNEPEVAIANAEAIWMATTNTTALQLASEEYLQDVSLFPPAALSEISLSNANISRDALDFRRRIMVGLSNSQ